MANLPHMSIPRRLSSLDVLLTLLAAELLRVGLPALIAETDRAEADLPDVDCLLSVFCAVLLVVDCCNNIRLQVTENYTTWG